MPAEKIFARFAISECLSPAGPRRGKCSSEIASYKAGLQIRAAEVFMNEPGIEAVSSPHGINRTYLRRWASQALASALRERTFRT